CPVEGAENRAFPWKIWSTTSLPWKNSSRSGAQPRPAEQPVELDRLAAMVRSVDPPGVATEHRPRIDMPQLPRDIGGIDPAHQRPRRERVPGLLRVAPANAQGLERRVEIEFALVLHVRPRALGDRIEEDWRVGAVRFAEPLLPFQN